MTTFASLLRGATLASLIAVSATAALASDDEAVSTEVQQEITTLLTDQGYDVRRVGMEDGLYEAYAIKDGHTYEIYLNAAFEIVRTNG
ncbi:MAG: PepSY domain-containing protein [Rhodobacter sp.]|nr:PepSY domain-containing protein [Paracoccaceae bacterium]MCC0076674.1 PepSY domain-containing protein [Rhodobacter sp.]